MYHLYQIIEWGLSLQCKAPCVGTQHRHSGIRVSHRWWHLLEKADMRLRLSGSLVRHTATYSTVPYVHSYGRDTHSETNNGAGRDRDEGGDFAEKREMRREKRIML